MTIDFLEGEIPKDETPEIDTETPVSADGLYCVVCGTPLEYGGRGPKPKYCADHKKQSASTTRSSTRTSNSSPKTAAALLARLNNLVGVGLAMYGLPLTASQITQANEQFQEIAAEALAADPKLCKKILSAGGKSGTAGLAMAYGLMAATVAPAAILEIRSKKETDESTK